MIRKLMLAAALLMAIPLTVGAAHGAACQPWNAWSPAQHHKAGPVDVAGGHGYGSGYHDAAHRSPPQPMGAYGDPKRRAAEGGYIQYQKGAVVVTVNFFGPSDENDTTHIYDTSGGVCASSGNTGVNVQKCIGTSVIKKPTVWGTWTPCA
ncbi:MAG: hypothetical protein E6G68_08055 [Actinobacteria bacterium]|nr:MAG: hypothetical protein E6G68_08055 [Actinomycetota bacterium]